MIVRVCNLPINIKSQCIQDFKSVENSVSNINEQELGRLNI
jgi:hypothetical protein